VPSQFLNGITADVVGPTFSAGVMCWRYDRRVVYGFELAINRIGRLVTAFATAAAIGGLVGSPAALADDGPPPLPPAPEPAPVDVPEIPREQCVYIDILQPCVEEEVPSLPLPDTPRTPEEP
jgi:hypothetical protein